MKRKRINVNPLRMELVAIANKAAQKKPQKALRYTVKPLRILEALNTTI